MKLLFCHLIQFISSICITVPDQISSPRHAMRMNKPSIRTDKRDVYNPVSKTYYFFRDVEGAAIFIRQKKNFFWHNLIFRTVQHTDCWIFDCIWIACGGRGGIRKQADMTKVYYGFQSESGVYVKMTIISLFQGLKKDINIEFLVPWNLKENCKRRNAIYEIGENFNVT